MDLKEYKKKVYQQGFNIYALINRFKKQSKLREELPDEIYINVCRRYLINKPAIRSHFPWFIITLRKESENYFAKKNIEEHNRIRNQKSVYTTKEIFQRICTSEAGQESDSNNTVAGVSS